MKIIERFNSPLLEPGNRARLSAVVITSSLELVNDVKLVLFAGNQQASGKIYRRAPITAKATKKTKALGLKTLITKKGNERAIIAYKFHRASAIGFAPATDHGGLIGSIAAVNLDELRSRVFVGKNYGAILDDPEGLNRPFFRVTVKKFKPKFKANILAVIKG